MKKMRKLLKNQKGLTLIELLAVIVILAIVAAIAVPAIGNIISNSKDKAILADASNILAGAKLAVIDGACGEADDNNKVSCDNSVLKNVVEGISNLEGASVEKTVSNEVAVWTVKYPMLTEIKNGTKFSVEGFAAGTDDSITETELNAAMKK